MAGENDYTDWLDGEPILQTTASDGSFTEWIDGEPVIRYEAETATDLVIPDATHLHDADETQPFSGVAVWTKGDGLVSTTGTLRSYRVLMYAAEISDPSLDVTKIRVKFAGDSTFSYGIGGASIGLRDGTGSTDDDYVAGSFTRLTFNGGSNTVSITAGSGDVWSDWVDIGWFDHTSDLLCHFDPVNIGGSFGIPYATNSSTFRKDGTYTDAMVQTITGYTGVNYLYGTEIVEVAGVPATNVTLTTPDAAHLHDADNVALTQVHDLAVAEAYDELVDEGPITIQIGLTLGVAEAYHDLVDDGPLALTQEHALVVAECDHLHEADGIILTALHILTVAECYHVHAPPNLTLTTLTALTVQESHHLHDADNITLDYQPTLAGLDAYHLSVSDNVVLAYPNAVIFDTSGSTTFGTYYAGGRNYRHYFGTSHVFPNHNQIRFRVYANPLGADTNIAAMTVGHRDGSTDDFASTPTVVTFDGGDTTPNITMNTSEWSDWIDFTPSAANIMVHMTFSGAHYYLKFDDNLNHYFIATGSDLSMTLAFGSSSVEADTRAIGMVETRERIVTLEAADGNHLQVADTIALTQEHDLAVDAADHLHTADGANVFSRTDLVTAESHHLHAADALTLTGTHSLSLDPGDHLHEAEALTLTQRHTLDLAGDTLLHVADTLNLAGTNVLVVAEAYHVHAADSADIIVSLAVDEAHHLHTAPNLTIVSGFDLVIPESVILTVSDNIAGMTVSMTVASSYHDHLADALAITANHYLTVAETDHLHTADSLNAYMTGDLPIQSAHHEIESDELTLGFSLTLTVREAYHRHFVDTLALTQEHTLAMPDGDSYHDHFADNIEILALPEGLERTFIDSLTADRTFWTRTTDLEILTPTRPIDDTVLTSYLGVTTKHELASLTQARTILRI